MRFSNLPLDYFKFQFHKGTIRTLRSAAFPFVCHEYFNSIKVQLELQGLKYDNESKRNFNSIKVQLELMVILILRLIALFQFHKGTIRTLIWIGYLRRNKHFNSIKVQLEQQARAAVNEFIVFQFHKGTIRTQVACEISKEHGDISIP